MTDFATMREDADGQYWVPLSDAEAAWVAEKDEAERLRAENEDLKAAVKPTDEAWLEMEAEVERLRAALERCLEKATKHDDGDIENIARQALQPTKEQV